MNVNWLYYLVIYAILVAATTASDCSEIRNKLKKALDSDVEEEYINEQIRTCKENDEGKVISLYLYFYSSLDINEMKQFVVYDTLTNLHLEYESDASNSEDNEKWASLFDEIAKLTKLEELYFIYDNKDVAQAWYNQELGLIHKGAIKKLQKLKKLELTHILLTQDNIEDISTLSNLEYLNLSGSETKGLTFKSLENLKKLQEVQIEVSSTGCTKGDCDYTTFDIENLKYFKQIKKLTLRLQKSSSNIDNIISSLTNIEELVINDEEVKLSNNNKTTTTTTKKTTTTTKKNYYY